MTCSCDAYQSCGVYDTRGLYWSTELTGVAPRARLNADTKLVVTGFRCIKWHPTR